MFRFHIRDLVWLTALVAVSVRWWASEQQHRQQMLQLQEQLELATHRSDSFWYHLGQYANHYEVRTVEGTRAYKGPTLPPEIRAEIADAHKRNPQWHQFPSPPSPVWNEPWTVHGK